MTASAQAVRELAARPDVVSVTPDAITVTPTATLMEPNISVLGAPQMWSAGRTGQGAVVAMLDTGVDTSNPELAARWRGGSNSWYDPYGQHASPADLSGHGTMTTGLVVGDQDPGTSYGMAPGASWIAAKIFADNGSASATAIHQAFQWVLDPDHDPATADAPQVVNGSWVLGSGPGCDTSFQADVQALRAAGIVPVFAAGNFGSSSGTSASPANYPESFSVGAITPTDAIWSSSSNGPTTCGGRARVFPDVVAPGSSVLVADRYNGYTYASGTSIAAPHVAGALALLVAAHHGAAVATLEDALRSTAHDLGTAGPDARFGWGRVDVPAANTAVVDAPDFTAALTPGSSTVATGSAVSFGVTVSPSNGYASPTSLSVSGLPAGTSATFSPNALGAGVWSSTLSVTTTSSLAPGTYPFAVTAGGGNLTRSAAGVLSVTAAPNFTLTASPTSRTVQRSRTVGYALSVASTGGFTGPVTLSRSPLPAGATSSWSVNPIQTKGSSTLTVKAGSRTPRGTFRITVTGSSGGKVHTVVLTLVVK